MDFGKNINFVLADFSETDNFIKEIAGFFSVKTGPVTFVKRQYLDSFDWRIRQTGHTFYKEGRILQLTGHGDNSAAISAAWSRRKMPQFWYDVPAGPLQDALRPLLGIRALLPLAVVNVRSQKIDILNSDAKIVVRLVLGNICPESRADAPVFMLLRAAAVRGYDNDLRAFAAFAASRGWPQESGSAEKTIFHAVYPAMDFYSSKINVHLDPEQSAATAVMAVFKSQLQVMKLNEPGLKADLDCEFLHDFRVALRRTRSCLTQVKHVFSAAIIERYKADLADIGRMTNWLRDLDVYLLKRDLYREMLPEQLRPNLDHLFNLLARDRQKEFRKVVKKFTSPNYLKTMAGWEGFIQSYAPESGLDGKNAARPILGLARLFIAKAYSRVLAQGRKIDATTADSELHRLRIECKKLRYLMEFFGSLFPEAELNEFVRQIKKLQENLGDFNDLFVQQKTLHEYIARHGSGKPEFVDIAVAIGGLIVSLNRRQQEVRQAFDETFRQFDQPENNRQFKKLFG